MVLVTEALLPAILMLFITLSKFDHPESLPISITEYNDFHRDEYANHLASISLDSVVDLDSISHKPGIDLFIILNNLLLLCFLSSVI